MVRARLTFVCLLLLGGCARVATSAQPLPWCNAFSGSSCGSGRVVVSTGLAAGTLLSRDECDDVCNSVMCPSEPKSCWVVDEPLGGKGVMCRSEADPFECPIDAGVPEGPIDVLGPATSSGG